MITKKQSAAAIICICIVSNAFAAASSVRVWEEPRVIPTYLIGKPDPNPRFYVDRAYQGAQGRVYPYPILDVLTDDRQDKTYKSLYLENEYLKISVLPEIGGRLFSALDKTNNYDFIYHQHVIKPALIGMLGAWISGGIEWNFPHHHRPSVFMPVDYALQENPDGSNTIWVGETEIRQRIKWMVGLTLYPGRSYIEVTIKPYNRTPFAHSFLCFANVGIHANENYQVIFPPSTEFATYHGKNQFAHWPISYEMFNEIDYTKGVDASWWKNHPEWTSMFAWNYEDDFFGGYDYGKQAGIVSFANHYVAPGKKFWEWSNGPRGWMWDKILTETDGAELELMTGAYSDNQPDYSWLQPYEARVIKMYWYPLRETRGLKNANLQAAVNLDVNEKDTAKLGFNTTSEYKNAKVLLKAGENIIFEQQTDIAPDKPFYKEITLSEDTAEKDLRASLVTSAGEELIAYQPIEKKGSAMPETVKPPAVPKDVETVEELYLTGLRLEQFHNPAIQPYPYYEEALKRDPGNYRVNTALGLLYLKRGMFEEARRRFSTALERVTKNYTSPRDGEAYYYRGLASKFLGDYKSAYNDLYKATWSYGFNTAAYYQLAEIDCIKGDFADAMEHLDRSIATNAWNTKALDLKSAVLRRLGRYEETAKTASAVLSGDVFDFWAGNELYLAKSAMGLNEQAQHQAEASGAGQAAEAMKSLRAGMRDDVQSYLELAVDYGNCGLWDEALDVLSYLDSSTGKQGSTYPMVYYYLGYFRQKKGQGEDALKYYKLAAQMPSEYCFPFRLESIDVLKNAYENNPQDAHAHYYLGNLLYDHQPEEAIREWEKSRDIDDTFATVHRNLGFAYRYIRNDIPGAIAGMEKAVACDKNDPRFYYELDVLYEMGKVPVEKRLALLENNNETIARRDDAFTRKILLYVQTGKYNEALELMGNRNFHAWEGGGTLHSTYVNAHLLLGMQQFRAKQYAEALKHYEAALEYPQNLKTAEPYRGSGACQVYYFVGTAYEALGEAEKAGDSFKKSAAAKQREEWSELRYYQGLAFRKLGQDEQADKMFDGLMEFAKAQTDTEMDFFAKFGEKQSPEIVMAENHYLTGLAYLGKGMQAQAKTEFEKALKLNMNHLWARIQLSEIESQNTGP